MRVFFIFLTIIMSSCRNESFVIISKDGNQKISVFNTGNHRYIIDGEYNFIPQKNYVKLDVSRIEYIADDFAGCWKNSNYEWQLVNEGAIILENKLDTTRFKFTNKLPRNRYGAPTMKSFIKDGCFNFGVETFSILPKGNAIIR